MQKILCFYLTLALSLNSLSYGQSPGGVGTTNLRGWYVGQTGLTLDVGGGVIQWNDQSPNAFHGTQSVAGQRPIISSNYFNYNQILNFDGMNDYINIPDIMPTSANAITVFAVARRATTTFDSWGCIFFGQSNSSSWNGGGYGITATNGANTSYGFWVNSWSVNLVSYATTLNSPTILTGNWNGTSAGNLQLFRNGTSMGLDDYAGTVGDGGVSAIGSNGNDSYCFTGNIAEIIAFNTGLNTLNTQRVQSYLGIKYGITLPHPYYNSSGTMIANFIAPYNNKIIGIARDDQTSLLQKQSQTLDDSFRVYIGTLATHNGLNSASYSMDNQYLITAQDQGEVYGQLTEKPATIYSRLSREFQIVNYNFQENFNIDILVSSSLLADFNLSDLRLLVDNDGNFSDANIYSTSDGITFSLVGNYIRVSNISNSLIPTNSIRFITIASSSINTPLMFSKSPGGIGSNDLVAWFDANTGYTLNSGLVDTWNSYSVNNAIATQTIASRRPSPNPSAINYNQAFEFDGIDDGIYITPTILFPVNSTQITTFGVGKQHATNRDTWGSIFFAQTDDGWTAGTGITALNSANTTFGFWVNEWFNNYVFQNTTLTQPTLITGNWNGITANHLHLFMNGNSIGTDFYNGTIGSSGTSTGIGGFPSTNWCFYGQIPEVIAYNRGLNLNETQRVNSYLGIKYGLTLGHDYINASNQTVYVNAAPYNYKIIGIGRDDITRLNQKQSHTYDDTCRVFLGTLQTTNVANTSTFSTDNQYLIVGSDGGGLYGKSTEMPSGLFSRLRREWKVTNTNFDGTFNFSVKLSNLADPSSVYTADLRLLVDDDGDFSNATIYSSADGLTFSYSNPIITVSGINTTMIPMNSTRFITIASVQNTTPLPTPFYQLFAKNINQEQIQIDWMINCKNSELQSCILQKSYDLQNWNDLFITNDFQSVSYQYKDYQVRLGLNYYRLIFLNLNGEVITSEPVQVLIHTNLNQPLVIYPNPCKDEFHIEIPSNQIILELIDIQGKTILQSHERKVLIPSELPNGIYIIKIHDLENGQSYTEKLFLNK